MSRVLGGLLADPRAITRIERVSEVDVSLKVILDRPCRALGVHDAGRCCCVLGVAMGGSGPTELPNRSRQCEREPVLLEPHTTSSGSARGDPG